LYRLTFSSFDFYPDHRVCYSALNIYSSVIVTVKYIDSYYPYTVHGWLKNTSHRST